jgi:hypothetical protein
VYEWYGTLSPKAGTQRAAHWSVEYFADAEGFLTADDDTTFVRETAVLPPPNGFDIIQLGTADDVMKPLAPQAARQPDAPPDAQTHAAPADGATAPQVSSYAYVPDEPVHLDASVWETSTPYLDPTRGTATTTGTDFLRWRLLDEEQARQRATPLVWAANTTAVRRQHMADLRAFRQYVEALGPAAAAIPLDALLVHHLQLERRQKRWQWSTLNRHAAGLVGALVALPMYAASAPSLNPATWVHFRAALQTGKRLATAYGPREPIMSTADDVVKALRVGAPLQVNALIVLCWVTAQRPCDVLQMMTSDLKIFEDDKIRLRFNRGKTVGAQGAHHIHTTVSDPSMMATIKKYHAAATGVYLFPICSSYQRTALMTAMREALRRVRPDLEARSLRRGTLSAMAAAGASEEQLLQWSRHTTPAALRRYLGFERVPHAEHQAMQDRASTALLPTPIVHGGGDRPNRTISFDDFLDITDGIPAYSTARAPKEDVDPSVAATWPLHVKPQAARPFSIPAIDAVVNSPPTFPEDAAAWHEDRKNLFNDDGRYDRIPWGGAIHEANLTRDDIAKLIDTGQIERIPPEEAHLIRGSVHVFTKPEPDKQRRRKITWTKDFNDFYTADEVAPDRGNATRADAREDILECEGSMTFDFPCQFDLIPLGRAVTYFEVFAAFGDLYRSTRQAMGKRSATSCGTTITRVALSYPRPPTVRTRFATDNVRFAGPRDDCTKAAWTFVQRVRQMGGALNEVDVDTCTVDDIAALYRTKDSDFLGDVVDFEAKTIQCRARHVQRLQRFVERARLPSATYADVNRWWGMILYMGDTLGLQRHEFYATRTYYRGLSSHLAINPALWRAVCPSRPPREIWRATEVCLANRPTRIAPAPIISAVAVVDASSLGYAAITFRADRPEQPRLTQRRWDATTRLAYDVNFSTVSEPEAMARVAERLQPATTLLLTDHEAFAFAFAHGSSPSPIYNARVRRVRLAGVDAVIHVPGAVNPADAYSRLLRTELTLGDADAAWKLAAPYIGRRMGRPYRVVGD